jgi:ABC-type Fe3+ transport system substrate-binding protein
MLRDISTQVEWFGQKHSPEDWKDILSAAWKGQKLVPGVNGGFVALGVRTSRISKEEFSEYIESIYAFGAERSVVWSDKALEAFEKYREAK